MARVSDREDGEELGRRRVDKVSFSKLSGTDLQEPRCSRIGTLELRQRGVTLLGGGMDESPQAYKDIEAIIAVQDDLVEVIGKFTPRIVRMADEAGEYYIE